RLFELFRKLEFKSLLKDLAYAPQGSKEAGAVNLATSAQKLDEIIAEVAHSKSSFAFMVDENGIYLCRKEQEVAWVPKEQINRLRGFFSDEKIAKATYDLKAGIISLKKSGIELKGKVFDCLLAGYLLEPARADFSLKELCWEYLDSTDAVALDTSAQAAQVFRIIPVLKEKLEEKKLDELFYQVELPLAAVLADMELAGVRLDAGILKELSVQMRSRTQELIKEIYALSGEEFNVNSPKQLSRILFEKLNLPVVKRTKTGISTDEEVLLKLSERHRIAKLLLEFRQLTKLTSTYVDVLPTLINPQTGRLHTSFDQTGTETGRLSSHDPNLQNIPIKTELGRQIRRAFVSGAANLSLLCADYSQIELRILAHLSGDENLIKAFKNNEDIHTFTAALIFSLKPAAVTTEMRERAKRVNFGIIYGMSAYGLSKDLNIPADEAQNFIDAYFARYPEVKAFCETQINQARKGGFVTTILGRRRYLPQINSTSNAIRQFAERQAINAPVQGSAADLIKLAMIDIHGRIKREGLKSRLILQVHDELVFDCPDAELGDMRALVKERMEKVMELRVPVKASIGVGKNWLELVM
ncbi:MAG: DNA polymerase I, partial [Candidatus Omnitrophota bacterium]